MGSLFPHADIFCVHITTLIHIIGYILVIIQILDRLFKYSISLCRRDDKKSPDVLVVKIYWFNTPGFSFAAGELLHRDNKQAHTETNKINPGYYSYLLNIKRVGSS